MPLNLNRLAALRPYLYHLTASQNLASIELRGELSCTNLLLAEVGMQSHGSKRRPDHVKLASGVVIRDQRPLSAGSIAFEQGWTLERFISYVNDHVFFWPGTAAGPINAGKNHFARYAHEQPVLLRFRAAPQTLSSLYFCQYNSGAPRCSAGKYSPRGSFTYLPAHHFNGTCSQVTEVVAKGKIALPGNTEVAVSPSGPWRSLAGAA